MKDQQSYLLNDQNKLQNSNLANISSYESTCSSIGHFEILSSILVTIAKGQNILQCMRQVLVQDRSFTPLNLFHYITHNCHYMVCQNLVQLLEDNSLVSNVKETQYYLGKIFNKYDTSKDNIQYTQFLNFIYPWNSGVLRDISVNKLKNYQQLDKFQKKLRPSDAVLTAFVSLLEQQILVQRKIQAQIADARFPDRKQLNKIIKSIKRASQKICTSLIQKSNEHISMLEIRNFIKAFIDVPQHLFLFLGRRLSLDKNGMIIIQKLENILQKSKKSQRFIKNEEQKVKNCKGEKLLDTTIVHISNDQNSAKKYEKQINYREELYRELALTLKIEHQKDQKNNGRTNRSRGTQKRDKSSNRGRSRSRTPQKYLKNKQEVFLQHIKDNISNDNNNINFENVPDIQVKKNYLYSGANSRRHRKTKDTVKLVDTKTNKHAQKNEPFKAQCQIVPDKDLIQKINNTVMQNTNKLFKQYTQIFIKGYKQIEKCKAKLNKSHIDYLTVFKTIDHHKGAINASDLRNLYVRMSGIPIDYDFHLIVKRFAQPEQQWLSYSQFVEIFKNSSVPDSLTDQNSKMDLKKSIDLTPENMRLLAQILYLTLDLEHCLQSVSKLIKHDEKEQLFNLINSEFGLDNSSVKDFINYQELKNYMIEVLDLSISMIQLMALLKRLDKSKNGVVIRQQFLRL